MKNLITLTCAAMLLVVFTGCEKDQVSADQNKPDNANQVIYSITNVNGNYVAESMDLEEARSAAQSTAIKKRNPNSAATGIYNFPPFGENGDEFQTFNFSAVENPGGVHGSTHITGSELGGLLDVRIASDCVLVNGNIAYFGGTITDWDVTQDLQDFFDFVLGGPYEGFGVGHQIFWSAQDNGEGANSDPDAGGDAFIIIPEGIDAEENGFDSWCQFTELDYAGTFHPPFTHGHVPGAVPSNVQVQ